MRIWIGRKESTGGTPAEWTLEDLADGHGRGAVLREPDLPLTLLAPEIVAAILDGRQSGALASEDLLDGFPWTGRGTAHAARSARRMVKELVCN
jgi:hypothetical protein